MVYLITIDCFSYMRSLHFLFGNNKKNPTGEDALAFWIWFEVWLFSVRSTDCSILKCLLVHVGCIVWLLVMVFKERECISTFKLIFCLHQIFTSRMLGEKETSSLLFGEWVCTNQISCPTSDSVNMNAYFVLPAVYFPKPLSYCIWAMNTQHQGEYFYLHFKMSKSKQLGVPNCSAPVILSKERRSVLEQWETCWRETGQVSMCLSKGVTAHDRGWGKGVG